MTSFATADELDLWVDDTIVADRANLILSLATAAIQRHTGQTLAAVAADSITIPGRLGKFLRLPERPVTAVTSVTLDGVTITDFDLLPQSVLYRGSGWGDARVIIGVTYDHGFATIPDDLKGVALDIAARVVNNPTSSVQESFGSYSVTRSRTLGIAISPDEKKVLENYMIRGVEG